MFGQFNLIYQIKLVRILKYNVLLNYYRVLLQGFTLELSTMLPLQCVAEYKSQ